MSNQAAEMLEVCLLSYFVSHPLVHVRSPVEGLPRMLSWMTNLEQFALEDVWRGRGRGCVTGEGLTEVVQVQCIIARLWCTPDPVCMLRGPFERCVP